MKKHIIALSIVSMLTLSGCLSETEKTPTAETTTAATTDDVIICHGMDSYFTYESLVEAIYEEYPDAYVHPLPEIVDTWEFSLGQISRDYSDDNHCYILDYDDTANNAHITLYIYFAVPCDDIKEFAEKEYSKYEGYSIEIQNDRYAYACCTDGFTTSMGITRDKNIVYEISVQIDEEFTNSTEVLDEYKTLLEI
ncbi:MAG: hypothetical protein J6B17_02790 [Ruminococcus sp.]|nr:hypothetical protein [Ruminococcus sp.]